MLHARMNHDSKQRDFFFLLGPGLGADKLGKRELGCSCLIN